MLADHVGVVLGYSAKMSALSYMTMRSFGRVAFPLYVFLLVNGFEHTHDRRQYLLRLFLFAIVSQIPFSLALTAENYKLTEPFFAIGYDADAAFLIAAAAVGLYFFLNRKNGVKLPAEFIIAFLLSRATLTVGGLVILGKRLNVMYTLACCLLLLNVLELLRERKWDLLSLSAIFTTLCVCADQLRHSDYGTSAPLLIVPLYLTRSNRWAQAAVTALWCLYKYPPTENAWLFFGALLAVVPICLYSGKEGRRSRLFYLVYPVHLSLLSLFPLFLR